MKVTLVSGCMYSGKTSYLIDVLKKSDNTKKRVGVFKPSIDSRYSQEDICTHDGSGWPAMAVSRAIEILEVALPFDLVVIDEVQFFGPDLLEVIKVLTQRDIEVYLGGLDRDWRGEVFSTIRLIRDLNVSEVSLFSVCELCGEKADRTQRLVPSQEQILIGSEGLYSPRCQIHHTVDGFNQSEIQASL